MTLITTIKRVYLDMKLEELKTKGFFHEYKEVKPHWDKRIPKAKIGDPFIFLCGKIKMTFRIMLSPYVIKTSTIPEKYREAIKTKYAYDIICEAIRNDHKYL